MDQVGSEGREQEHSSGPSRSGLDRLVENIVSHPSFRATISQALLNNSPSASSSLGLESRRNAIRNGTTTLSPHANADETRRFTSPAEEFSAIYRRGSSAIPGQSPQYHRGNNFQRPAPTAGSVRRRPAGRNRPSSSTSRAMPYRLPATSSSTSSTKKQIFIVKEIVLIPNHDEENTIRPPRKAVLMSSGFVLNDVKIDKSWSEREVMSHIHNLFETKLNVGESPVSLRGLTSFLSSIEYRLKVMLGVGSSLQEPCLQPGEELNGARISRLFSQKIMWLKPCERSLLLGDEQEPIRASPFSTALVPSIESSMENTSFEDDINVISDLCNGTKTRDEITQALESANGILDDAVSTLLELHENHEVEEISVASKIVPMDLTDALLSFFSKVDPFEDIEVTINRQELWKDAQGFYKKALDKPVKLLRNFVVKIKNEDGVDAGAVRLEFWSLVLKEINERLFEGHLHERMPRRNCGNLILFKMCGSVIAHSLLNKGPAFPCLAPWVYQYLHSAPQESVLLTMISPQQIVKTGATEKLLMLIEGLESCKYDEELDSLLDGVNKEVYDQIISSSQWPIGCLISIENKHLLIQELVFDELVRKRQNQLQAMKEGLACIDFLQYMERFPDLMRPLFIHQEKVLVPVFFKDNMKRPTLNSPPQEKAYSWFLAYIDEGEAKDEDFPQGRLIALLEFCTAFTSVPPFGLPYQFVIDFLDDDDAKVLPEASACFGHLQIPTVHCSKEAFFKNMDTGLKYGRKGFGKL